MQAVHRLRMRLPGVADAPARHRKHAFALAKRVRRIT